MKIKKSQHTEVLKHLQEKGSISSFEAFNLYGATRLSAIIYCLRHLGYCIVTDYETIKNRYGNSTTYAVYRLKESK